MVANPKYTEEDLQNAIALNSTMFSLARTFGPALGGVIVALLGTAWAFTINGITFLAIITSLALLRIEKPNLQPADRSPLADLLEGLRFIWHERTITGLIVIAMAVALFGANFSTLMPVVAVDVLGKDEVGFGVLNGAVGVGSIIGALAVAYFSNQPGKGQRLNFINLIFPLTLLAFSLSRFYPLSLLILIGVGISFMPQLSLCNILIQSNIPDEIRGRVMSVYSLGILGFFPIGGLIAGAIAEQIGAPLAIAVSAGAMILIGLMVRAVVPQLKSLE